MGVRRPGGLAEESITHSIIGAFFTVYNALGFGFVESVYTAALERELIARGHKVGREVSVRVFYKGAPVAWQRIDMMIDERIVVECKSGQGLAPNALRQLQNYLRATHLEVGLLLHYGPQPKVLRAFSPTEVVRSSVASDVTD